MHVLDRIRAYKLEEIAARKAAIPLPDLEAEAQAAPAVRPFARALIDAAKTGTGLIAEIKKASPSRGLIRADFDPASHLLIRLCSSAQASISFILVCCHSRLLASAAAIAVGTQPARSRTSHALPRG